MKVIAIDLGGTKSAFSIMDEKGSVFYQSRKLLLHHRGEGVAHLLVDEIKLLLQQASRDGLVISSMGVSVPGIVKPQSGNIWAPKIEGWDDFPLTHFIQRAFPELSVFIESDRNCYIMGESWMGHAQDCRDAIYFSVGTGIGAGILTNGQLVKGACGIGGAVGWMVSHLPAFDKDHPGLGHLEAFTSGTGMVQLAKRWMAQSPEYSGDLGQIPDALMPSVIFECYETDSIAHKTINSCIEIWGQAIANLVSIFNPEKIILGGGVFGPGSRFLSQIQTEVEKWAQPLSAQFYQLLVSALGQDAGLYGAAKVALDASLKKEDHGT